MEVSYTIALYFQVKDPLKMNIVQLETPGGNSTVLWQLCMTDLNDV